MGSLSTEQWIFVTGMIRSGTTFLGKLLTLPLCADYIHEPFNGGYSLPDRRPFRARYIRPESCNQDAQDFRDHVAHLFNNQFGLPTAHHTDDSWARTIGKSIVGSRGPFHLRLARLNPFHRTAVVKDPVAKLSTEFLYHEFEVLPVIIVRHPASLAASLKRVGWYPEMKDFRNEPELIEDYFSDRPDYLYRTWPSRLLESMGHWRATHRVLLSQASTYPDWSVITHEALCENPIATTRRLYEQLDLPWSSWVQFRIQRLTGGRSAQASGGQAMDLKRDSARIFEQRRDSLTRDERAKIFDITKDIALDLYSRESFAID